MMLRIDMKLRFPQLDNLKALMMETTSRDGWRNGLKSSRTFQPRKSLEPNHHQRVLGARQPERAGVKQHGPIHHVLPSSSGRKCGRCSGRAASSPRSLPGLALVLGLGPGVPRIEQRQRGGAAIRGEVGVENADRVRRRRNADAFSLGGEPGLQVGRQVKGQWHDRVSE
jgi:hypothetical protein